MPKAHQAAEQRRPPVPKEAKAAQRQFKRRKGGLPLHQKRSTQMFLRHRRREASCAGQGLLASGGGTADNFRELRDDRLQRVNEALVERAQGHPRRGSDLANARERSRSPRGSASAIGSRPAKIPIVRAQRPATPSTGRQANLSTASSTDSVDVGNVMSAINAIGKEAATITIGDGDEDVGAHARDTHIRVPRVTAHRLNEALLPGSSLQ